MQILTCRRNILTQSMEIKFLFNKNSSIVGMNMIRDLIVTYKIGKKHIIVLRSIYKRFQYSIKLSE
jgi:hypothetical protein